MTDIHYGQFVGINNRQPAYRLAEDELAAAINVDIDDTKALSRRNGSARVYAGDCHSLFANSEYCLFRSGSGLYRLFPDYTAKLLTSGLSGRTVYHAMPGRVYFSDGRIAAWTDGERVATWGIDLPGAQPVVSVLTDGALPAGRYQYALTYLNAEGIESGAPLPRIVDAAHGLSFTNIPIAADPQVTRKAIYLSRPNGETLYRALTVANATTEATYTGNCSNYGVELETLDKIAAIGCTHIHDYNGRLLIAHDRHLLYSAPYQHDYFRPLWSYAFASTLTLIAPVADGVFVGDRQQVVFLAGADIAKADLHVKADYGALDQTPCYADGADVGEGLQGRVALFTTREGVCVGAAGGSFTNLSINRYQMPTSSQAANVVRAIKGFNQFVSILQ